MLPLDGLPGRHALKHTHTHTSRQERSRQLQFYCGRVNNFFNREGTDKSRRQFLGLSSKRDILSRQPNPVGSWGPGSSYGQIFLLRHPE